MKAQTLFSFIFIMATHISYAQFSLTSQKQANKIKNSVLVVGLEEEDPKLVAKLTKKDPKKLEHYRDQIAGRNLALKEAVKDFWIFSDQIEYKSISDAEESIKEKKSNYVIMKFGTFLEYERFRTGVGLNGKPAGWSRSYPAGANSQPVMSYNQSTKYTELANEITTLEIRDSKKLISVYLPKAYPSIADAVYGIQEIQFILNYLTDSPENKLVKLPKYIKNQAPELQNLTLLIDKDEIHSKVNESSIKSVYPYPFKLVDEETIDNAILAKDPGYAFVKIVPTPGGKGNVNSHTIMNAKDGTLYGYFMPKVAVGIKGSSLIQYNERIKLKNFKDYAENVGE